MLVVSGPKVSPLVRELASQLSVDFDFDYAYVTDHFQSDARSSNHTFIVLPAASKIGSNVVKALDAKKPVLYHGIAHTLGGNILQFPALTGFSTSYTRLPLGKSHILGTNAALISAFQTTNNARIAFVGSTDFFSNVYVRSP